jgi:hypothetical protein
MSENDIVDRTTKILLREYSNMLFKKLSENKKLEELSPGISKLLIEYCKALIIIRQITKDLEKELDEHLSNYETELKKKHKVKSNVRQWLNECVFEKRQKFLNENKYIIHVRSIDECKKQHLHQSAYFIERELIFLKEVFLYNLCNLLFVLILIKYVKFKSMNKI